MTELSHFITGGIALSLLCAFVTLIMFAIVARLVLREMFKGE